MRQSLSARRAWIEIKKKGRARRPGQVALRKESVDRNNVPFRPASHLSKSLSARRAWIEITAHTAKNTSIASLSARRAWIEIWSAVLTELLILVALRKESVDRNVQNQIDFRHNLNRRSPQ